MRLVWPTITFCLLAGQSVSQELTYLPFNFYETSEEGYVAVGQTSNGSAVSSLYIACVEGQPSISLDALGFEIERREDPARPERVLVGIIDAGELTNTFIAQRIIRDAEFNYRIQFDTDASQTVFAQLRAATQLTFQIEGDRQTTFSTENLTETLTLYLEDCV